VYPNSQFARPVSSFRKPAPVIDVDPDVDPKITVCFNAQWLPYIIGSLRQLLLQTTWATSDYDVIDLMQARSQLLIAMFIEAAEGCVIDMPFDVRQNEDEPCTLEKTTDGDTWTAWANLQLCPPDLIMDGGIIKIKRGGSYVPIDGTGSYDERTDGTYTPPWPTGTVPDGETGNCLAAANIAAFFASSLTQVKQGLDVGTPVSTSMGIVAGTIGFLGLISAGVFAAVGLILAGLLGALGSAGINDMLTDGTVDKLKCAIDCNAEPDGSITPDEFNAIYDRVGTDIPGIKGQIVQNWLNGFGPVGLSRQGKVAAITTADCNDCGCGWIFKALNGFDNHTKITSAATSDGVPASTYNSSTDSFDSPGADLSFGHAVGYNLTIDFGEATTITFVKFTVHGNFELSGSSGWGRAFLDSELIIDVYQADAGDHEQSFIWTGSRVSNLVQFHVDWLGNTANVIEVVIYGSDTLPAALE